MSKTGIASARPVVRSLKKIKTMAFKDFMKNTLYKGWSFAKSSANAFSSSLIPHLASGVANEIFGETLEDKQRYALDQMEQQNKYNVENYERMRDDQLKYSDPAFIRQRLENAGLSPSLALGNGGMASPISANIGSSSPAGGLSGSLHPGSVVNIAESMARIRNIDQDTENKKTEGDFAKQSMQTRLAILSSKKLSGILENNIKAVDALYKENITRLTIDKMQAEIDSITRTIANAENLTEIERQRMIAYRDSLVNQNELWKSQIGLNEAKTTTETTIQERNEWESAHLRAKNYWMNELKPDEKSKIKAEINELISRAGVNEQKAKYAKLYAINECIRTGVFMASELRKWVQVFLDKSAKEQDSVIKQMASDPDFIWDAAQIAGAIL